MIKRLFSVILNLTLKHWYKSKKLECPCQQNLFKEETSQCQLNIVK